MPRSERYYLGPSIAKRLPDVVRHVDDAIIGGGATKIPTSLQSLAAPGTAPAPVRVGKTTATWTKGTTATITLYEDGVPPNETVKSPTPVTIVGCVNKFATVASNKWVIVALGRNGHHYLISAEC